MFDQNKYYILIPHFLKLFCKKIKIGLFFFLFKTLRIQIFSMGDSDRRAPPLSIEVSLALYVFNLSQTEKITSITCI